VLNWYCVVRHRGAATPTIGNQEHRHWVSLSRVLIERWRGADRSLVEVRAYRTRGLAERDFQAGPLPEQGLDTVSLIGVRAWFPFRACLRSLKPSARRLIDQQADVTALAA
jgi:hypothetical protein